MTCGNCTGCTGDPYTYSQPMTVGGPTGLYLAECPFSGDEYEWLVLAVNASAAGQAFISDDVRREIDVQFDGSVSYGDNSRAPRTFLNGLPFKLQANSCLLPTPQWFRLPNGGKNLYVYVSTTASNSVYVTVVFRFLPVRAIPGRVVTVPPEASEQYNIARSQKIIERLQSDVREGDAKQGDYGRLR